MKIIIIVKYLIIVLICTAFIGMILTIFHILDPNVSFFGKEPSLISFGFSLFNILFGSSLILGFLQWEEDKKLERKKRFIEDFDKHFDIIYNKKNEKDFFKGISQLKINSFGKIEFTGGILDTSVFDRGNFGIEYNDFLIFSPMIFGLVNILWMNKEFINDLEEKEYIKTRLSIIGNIRLYYLGFIIHWINSNNIKSDWIKDSVKIQDKIDIMKINNLIGKLDIIEMIES